MSKKKITISELIKEIREKCYITQQELAELSGMNQGTISSYETGSRRPGRKSVRKLVSIANKEANMNITYEDLQV